MANLKYIISYIIFGQTQGIKWTVPSDFLAKKKQFSFYEDLRPIAASIKEGLLVLRLTIVVTPYSLSNFKANDTGNLP